MCVAASLGRGAAKPRGVKPPVLQETDALQSPCPAALVLPLLLWHFLPSVWFLGNVPISRQIPLQQLVAVPAARRQGPVPPAVLG